MRRPGASTGVQLSKPAEGFSCRAYDSYAPRMRCFSTTGRCITELHYMVPTIPRPPTLFFDDIDALRGVALSRGWR